MAKGLTLRQLGQRIGVSTAACSSWETGRNTPSAAVVPRLAKVLGLNPIDLMAILSPEPDHGRARTPQVA